MTERGERYLDIHKVADRVGLATKTIRRKVRAREFPPPFKWGGGFKWLESDIDRWMVRNAMRLEIDPEDMPDDSPGADNRGHSGTSRPEHEKGTSGKK